MEGGGEVSELTKPDKAVIWEIERLNNLNTTLHTHAERLAEALEVLRERQFDYDMCHLPTSKCALQNLRLKAETALTLYRAENPKV